MTRIGVRWLDAGGTGIDTAWDYHDEGSIAKALAKYTKVNRSKLFITTKIPAGVFPNATDCSTDPLIALNYVKSNLQQLQTEYVDLVLLHGPCRFADPPVPDPVAADNALWRGLEMALEQGLTRAIGVSNYVSHDLAALRGKVKPAVNQCMMSVNFTKPLLPVPQHGHDDATLAYCARNNITYEAWRVIGGCPMHDSRVTAISQAHNKSAAQVCLRYVFFENAILGAQI